MRKLRPHYTIPFMCRMLNTSSSGYYAWSSRPPSKTNSRGSEVGNRDKGSAHENPRDFWTGKVTAGPYSPWRQDRDLPDQENQKETRNTL